MQLNAEGEIDCRGVGRGRHLLLVTQDKAGLAGWRVVDTTTGAVDGVRVPLQPVASLRIVSKDKERRTVLLRATDGTPL